MKFREQPNIPIISDLLKEERNNLKIGNKVANIKLNIEERDFFCIHFCEGGRFDPFTTCE